MSTNNNKFTSLFESLEERVLFDGVPDATFILPEADMAEPIPADVQNIHQADSSLPKELILVDPGVQDSEQLLAEILENRSDSALEIRILDSDSDGIQQITDLLAESEGQYDAIHIISHGDEGEVNLGNTALTADNLNRYSDQLAAWSEALTEDADLLFYGCELAGSHAGENFIESISAITGADVAASDDLTGAAAKGGDWDLELEVGDIETQALSATAFAGILADTDGDGIDDFDDLDDDNDGILNADEGFVPATTAPINPSNLNSPGFPIDTDVSTGNTAQLNGLFGGLLDFDAQLIGSGPGFVGGVQVQNDPALGGDFIFVQSDNLGNFPSEFAEYTLNFNNSIQNLSFDTSGINFADTIVYEAFFQGVSVPITAANFSGLTNGTVVQNGNELFNPAGGGGTFVDQNFGTITISQPVDEIVLRTGKGDGSGATVTLGFSSFSGDVTIVSGSSTDTDGDGVGDHSDLDSDNDGISDLHESGNAIAIAADTNMDGLVDGAEAAAAGLTLSLIHI